MIIGEAGSEYWLTTQRDQSTLASLLAGGWGNSEFLQLEKFLVSARHEREFRTEVLTAIAQRDTGWQESDAAPAIDGDGIPKDFTTLPQQELMARWRASVNHFSAEQPFVALLISQYVSQLFGPQCDSSHDPAFSHPALSPADWAPLPAREAWREAACQFVKEQQLAQNKLRNRLQNDPMRRGWTTAPVLMPTIRLYQLVDALALALSRGRMSTTTLVDVPRRGWHDRIQMQFHPEPERHISLSPYPFATDPHEVELKLRRIQRQTPSPQKVQAGWESVPLTRVRFEFNSRASASEGETDRPKVPPVESLSWFYYDRT